MSTSLPLTAAVFVLLLLTTMEAEAIRLDAESRAAVSQSHQQQSVINKSETGAPIVEKTQKSAEKLVQKQDGTPVQSSIGGIITETKRSIAGQEVVRATAHKLPEFHEDYYGASVHEPRHH